MKAAYRYAYANFPTRSCLMGRRRTLAPFRTSRLGAPSFPRHSRSTLAPSPTSASTARRGLGSYGKGENVTIATRLAANRLLLPVPTWGACEAGAGGRPLEALII